MAAPTNSVTTLNNVGIREDLENEIYRVAPEKTPFISSIGKLKAKNTTHEWQTETLDAVNASNAALEGDDVGTITAGNLTTRVKNVCQIFTKDGVVSGTAQAVVTAGRSDERDRQELLKGLSMRRDMEAAFLLPRASVLESGATPRSAAGLGAWLTSNVSRGSGGANGGYSAGLVAAPTDGTRRSFTEDQIKAVNQLMFDNGASVDGSVIMAGSKHKGEFSAFTGIADIRVDVKGNGQAMIVGGADVYQGDFGKQAVVPHPYGLTRSSTVREVLIVDTSMAAVATLRPVASKDLAVTGDNTKFQIVTEATLVVRNEKAHGGVFDLL